MNITQIIGLLLVGSAAYLYMTSNPWAPLPAATTPGPSTGAQYHIVVPGDWLSKIAGQYGLAMKDIIALNPQFGPGGRDVDNITVGEKIRVK